MKSSKTKGIIYTVASAVLFGISPVFAQKSYEFGNDPMTLTFFRNAFVVPVIAVIMLITKKSFNITKKELLFILAAGVFGRTVATTTLYSAYRYIGIGTATVIHFLYPVIVALICKFVFGEKLGFLRIAALALAIGGVASFAGNPGKFDARGLILAFVSAVAFGFCVIWHDRTGISKMEPLKLTFYISIVIALSTLGVAPITGQAVNFALSAKALVYCFIVAQTASFFGTALLQIGIRELGASLASFFSMLEPLGCVVFGWLLLHEEMTWIKITGCLFIFAAVVLVIAADSRKNKGAKDEKRVH